MAKEIEMQVFSVQHVLVEGSMRIVATVTVHPRVVRQWINNVSNSLEKVEMRVIGLDAEYTACPWEDPARRRPSVVPRR